MVSNRRERQKHERDPLGNVRRIGVYPLYSLSLLRHHCSELPEDLSQFLYRAFDALDSACTLSQILILVRLLRLHLHLLTALEATKRTAISSHVKSEKVVAASASPIVARPPFALVVREVGWTASPRKGAVSVCTLLGRRGSWLVQDGICGDGESGSKDL